MKNILLLTILTLVASATAIMAQRPLEDEPTVLARGNWSSAATAAAMGYCLAKHPYRYQQTFGKTGTASYYTLLGNRYTLDGYQLVDSPGIVGAVRRNFVYKRSTLKKDEGINNTCEMACAEFGKLYGPTYKGVPLKQNVGSVATPNLINNGIGDMAALAMPDKDFYLNRNVIGGIWSRANNFHEGDVAQADFCCCQCR